MSRLTPTERRRIRESANSTDPMFLAEAEAAYEAAVERARVADEYGDSYNDYLDESRA